VSYIPVEAVFSQIDFPKILHKLFIALDSYLFCVQTFLVSSQAIYHSANSDILSSRRSM